VDAVSWPLVCVGVAVGTSVATGLLGLVAAAVALLLIVPRLHCAMYRNQHYRFTAWRWGRPLLGVLLVGLALKWLVAI
jgi:hypothetical protein